MATPESTDWRTANDDDLVSVVLDFVENQIDEESESTKIQSVESLPEEQRALAVMSRVWGQVENGGLAQYFFNKPDRCWHTWAVEAARLLGMPETGQAVAAGSEIVEEILPELEQRALSWDDYCERVWDTFEDEARPTSWYDELEEFPGRAAAFIRSNPGLARLLPGLWEKHVEDELSRQDKPLVVTDRERALLFTAETLAPYFAGFTPRDDFETCTATQASDGTMNVAYEYSHEEYGLVIQCQVDFHSDEEDAESFCKGIAQQFRNAPIRLGEQDFERQVEAQDDFFRWGDQSYYSTMFQAGAPCAFKFDAWLGVKRFSLMVVGGIFEDRDKLKDALTPALDQLRAYEP